jgi:hypothetical protein
MTNNPHESGAGRRWRRFRALGVLAATSLAAPLGVAVVATTAGPAGAAPGDGQPLVVSGDAITRNQAQPSGANWTWESSDYDDFRDLFASFSGGVAFDTTSVPSVASPSFDDPNPAVIGDETGTLADVDVYISSAVGGGGTEETSHYTPDEERALLRWVRAGGVLIANTNSRAFDVTRYLGDNPDEGDYVRVAEPRLFFDGTHGCNDQPGNDGCAGGNDEAAPVGAQVAPGTDLSAGVTSIRNWHTITYFEPGTLPDNAVTVATLDYACDEAVATCKDSADPPDYNNNTRRDGNNDPKVVVAYMPFGSQQFGKGAVVFTSDVDTFSNHYPEGGGGALTGGNLQLANNVISWIAANRAAPLAADPGFTPITPTRVYDTRNAIGTAAGKVPGGTFRDVQITGTLSSGVTIPANATAVAINLTATNQDAAGFLTVTPGGGAKSNTSNLNIPPNLVDVANAAVVGLADGGKIRVYNENNPTDVIVDVVGYWAPSSGDYLSATDPTRVFDTRTSTKLGEGETRNVPIVGQAGVPSGATGVVLNVTSTNSDRGGFLTVHDTPTVPNASNVNFRAGVNVPNLVFAKLAADGSVNVTNAIGSTDVVIDVNGYFSDDGSGIHAVGPGRIFDTRIPIGQLFAGKVAADGKAVVGINGAGGLLPTDGTGAVLVNITVNEPDAAGFLTAYPNTLVPPNASNVNFAPGQTVANLALAKVSDDGKLAIANTSPGGSNVIVDVFAWFD